MINIPITRFFLFLRDYIVNNYGLNVSIEIPSDTKEQLTIYFVNISNIKNLPKYNGSCSIMVHFDYQYVASTVNPYEKLDTIINLYAELSNIVGLKIESDINTERDIKIYKSIFTMFPALDYDGKDQQHLRCEIVFDIDLSISNWSE